MLGELLVGFSARYDRPPTIFILSNRHKKEQESGGLDLGHIIFTF